MVAIRQATPDDLDVICEFNTRMAAETEDVVLDPERLREGVRQILNDPDRGLYFLAETGGRVVAQTSITFEWSDWRNGWFWWLESVYVLPEMRGQGAFRAVLQHIESLARAAGDVCGIRLYVDGDNQAAAEVYDRLGLPVSRYHMREKDFVMARAS